MDRFIIQQMRNEWRGNIWLVLQLTVVSIVLWVILSFFSLIIAVRSQDYGYDTTDVLAGTINIVKTNYSDEEYAALHDRVDDLVTNLRNNPHVEFVGVGSNSMPYNFNLSGVTVTTVDPDTTRSIHCNRRSISPDIVRILRLKSLDGRTTEELAQVIERGEFIMGDYDPSITDREHIEDFLNKTAYLGNDSSQTVRIGALAHSVHRSDYENVFFGVLYSPLSIRRFPDEIVIRVRPGQARDFLESLKTKDLKSGNVYITDLSELSDMAEACQRDMTGFIRNCSVCAAFLMFVVFLGFLGTFWFRTQQRVPELAIRKVCGATPGGLFARMLTEGCILLSVSLVLAAAGAWLLIHYELVNTGLYFQTPESAVYGALATIVILIMLITAGIWFPARLAMGISPAEALKEQ